MSYFKFSFIFTFIALLISLWWGYHLGGWSSALSMMLVTLILASMEVSLSFDNAVVNASILKTWDEYWKKLFLTVGILIAVFGMRLLFPLVIVAQTADMGILEVWNLALDNPVEYSSKLIAHHAEISAFGGVFLLLVFLNFMLDEEKNIHWIEIIEKKLGLLGKIEAISIFVSIVVLMFFATFVEEGQKLAVLNAGLWGIIVYVSVDILGFVLEKEDEKKHISSTVKKGSIGGFLYLEVLDASFSFDGVIGAFAITKDIVVIMLGLGIGAMFVRSITIYLVEKGTLDSYIYLEHGAHYAIGILAFIMLFGMKFHIPELFTGLVGVAFILLSLYSSIKYRRLS
ncbi:Protein of unknown function DUF475 [Sulfurimonas denitrificans DSM 1251]|uniref:Integral membrane protein n=1 Tax=Sulfurimonas denitrificans (strain ATCC 33889 / DSM 1251) TaxID=326298 RepID=Q30PG1_SULDN|nr:DUF475 domain-containing protein [Sulfurimonas denitrificans]ABB45120.1 Protein of unknown function DUF475 [Sulfurimonas denitrificans DSM 1251]